MTFDEIIKDGKIEDILQSDKDEKEMHDAVGSLFDNMEDEDPRAKLVGPVLKGELEKDHKKTQEALNFLHDKVDGYSGDPKDVEPLKKMLDTVKPKKQQHYSDANKAHEDLDKDGNPRTFASHLKEFWEHFGEHTVLRAASMGSIGSDKKEDFKQLLANAQPATTVKFINELKNVDDLMDIDAARLCRVEAIKTGKLEDDDEKFPDPCTDVKNREEQKKRAEDIKKEFASIYQKCHKQIENWYNGAMKNTQKKLRELKDGEFLIDPLTGEKVYASDFKSLFTKNGIRACKAFDNFMGKQKTDIVTIGPKIALFLIKQLINPNSGTRHFARAVRKMFDISKKAAESKTFQGINDQMDPNKNGLPEVDWRKYLYTYQATSDEFENAKSITEIKKEPEKESDKTKDEPKETTLDEKPAEQESDKKEEEK